MYFNDSNIRVSEQRRKDLQRESNQQQRATRQQRRSAQHTTEKKSPLWTRVWTLL